MLMTAAANVRRGVGTPRLVLGVLLAGHGLLLRVAASGSHPVSLGGLLPGQFVGRALHLSSWVFLIAAVATLLEANSSAAKGGSWRPVGSLVFALMAAADLMASACLAESAPSTARLLRTLGLPVALTGSVMGLIALKETRRGSEKLAGLAGFMLNGLAFLLGLGVALWLRVSR